MKTSRRNILSLIGLSPAIVAASASIEDLGDGEWSGPGHLTASPETQERFAKVLEAAAQSIRKKELVALTMDVNSKADHEHFFTHTLTFEFEIYNQA